MTFKNLFFLVLFAEGIFSISGLEPFDNFREGSCLQAQPIRAYPSFIDTLKYISAGSKYHLYRMASAMPNYWKMREDEFYYDFCYRRNTTTTQPIGAAIGFGRVLSTFRIVTKPNIYLEAIPTNPSQAWDTLRQVVTLTDGKTFAFIQNCWTGSNQRGWDLVTLTPTIDWKTQQRIEDHAASLGFNRENFIFLKYDSCKYDRNDHFRLAVDRNWVPPVRVGDREWSSHHTHDYHGHAHGHKH